MPKDPGKYVDEVLGNLKYFWKAGIIDILWEVQDTLPCQSTKPGEIKTVEIPKQLYQFNKNAKQILLTIINKRMREEKFWLDDLKIDYIPNSSYKTRKIRNQTVKLFVPQMSMRVTNTKQL